MRILLLAPQPFYEQRGTPIAVDALLRVLSERGDSTDVLTYHLGAGVSHPGTAIHRIPAVPFVRGIRPGFSLKKILCDLFMLVKALRMARRTRYDVVHAVEEGVFIAMLIRVFFRIGYVYDMDSCMSRQITDRLPALVFLRPLLRWFESRAVAGAMVVVPMCDALAETAGKQGARKVVVLRDVSLLPDKPPARTIDIRKELGLAGVCFMYVGNLEPYQGVNLLLEAFSILVELEPNVCLAVIGGSPEHVRRYQRKTRDMRLEGRVRFAGPRPIEVIASLLASADALVSPRTQGLNTPMKIYSYMDSDKPVIATNIESHTQVLNRDVAVIVSPKPDDLAAGMLSVIQNPALAMKLANRAKALVREKYCFASFRKSILDLYGDIEKTLAPRNPDERPS